MEEVQILVLSIRVAQFARESGMSGLSVVMVWWLAVRAALPLTSRSSLCAVPAERETETEEPSFSSSLRRKTKRKGG